MIVLFRIFAVLTKVTFQLIFSIYCIKFKTIWLFCYLRSHNILFYKIIVIVLFGWYSYYQRPFR